MYGYQFCWLSWYWQKIVEQMTDVLWWASNKANWQEQDLLEGTFFTTSKSVNSNFPHSFKKVWILTQKSVQTFLSYTGHLFQSPLILFSVSVQRFSVSIQSYSGANEMRGNEQKYIFYKIMIHSFGCSTIMCYICQRIIMHILWVHEVQCPWMGMADWKWRWKVFHGRG